MYKYIIVSLLGILLLASCQTRTKNTAKSDPDVYYTCSMDPQVVESHPGKCPICHMELTAVHKSQQPQHADEIKLSPEQIRLGNIRVDTIRSTPLGDETVLTGTVNFDQSTLNAVSSRISGRVERLYFKNIGDPVSKGARLYDLYSEDLNNAQQEYLLILQKQKELGNSIVNYNDLAQSAKSKLLLWGLTQAQVNELAVTGKAATTTPFYSTAGGFITELDVKEGDYVTEGGSIVKLAGLSTVWVEAQVYTSQLSQFDPAATVDVRFPDLAGKIMQGKISFVNPEIDPSTRINLIRVAVSNKDNLLRPGMSAYVTLKNPQRKALSLPTDAVLRAGKMSAIWVQTVQNTFKSRMVQTGQEGDGFVEIKSGLQAGDAVVTSGAYLLQSEYIFRNGANPMEGMDMSKMKM
ncbi:MAG TPA: efflux RND transporter periplasmic adaptor subunit [Puia sp.]|nr:efflux RND transporter periplasmic adaptor subunit [Puia sp.]